MSSLILDFHDQDVLVILTETGFTAALKYTTEQLIIYRNNWIVLHVINKQFPFSVRNPIVRSHMCTNEGHLETTMEINQVLFFFAEPLIEIAFVMM